jgi:hypothetical protein
VDNSRTDPEKGEVELQQAERRREWMSAVVSSLKSKNQHTGAAERQLATFAAMTAAMRSRRKDIEDAVIADREAGEHAADDTA